MNNQRGATLIELMVWLALTVVLMAGITGLTVVVFKNWRSVNHAVMLQQTVRHAVGSMARDGQFASRIFLSGAQQLTFITDKYGTAGQAITYSYDTSARPYMLRRNKNDGSGAQPLTGGSSDTIIQIEQCRFDLISTGQDGRPATVQIIVTAQEMRSGQCFTLQTAVTGQVIKPR